MAYPQVSLEYLVELETLQREMPTLRLWQLDGVLRARATARSSFAPPPQAPLQLVQFMPQQQQQILTAQTPLRVEADAFKPKHIAEMLQDAQKAAAAPQTTMPTVATAPAQRIPSPPAHVPTFAEIAKLRPRGTEDEDKAEAQAASAAEPTTQQRAWATAGERRSPSRLEITGPRRGRE